MTTYGLGGKVVVITGGASSIGRACAHTLARSGADTSIWDLDQGALDLVLRQLEDYDYGVFHTQRAAIRAMRQSGRGGSTR